MKLSSKIFGGIVSVVIAGVVITTVIVSALLYATLSDELKSEIRNEARYMADIIGSDVEAADFGSTFTGGRDRVTIISPDGTVKYDSSGGYEDMENHLNRPEIRDAFDSGTGESTRTSATFGKKNFYYAVRLRSGDVLRVASETSSMYGAVTKALPGILLTVLALIGLALAAAGSLTKLIIKPINELDIDNPAQSRAYDELAPLLDRIDAQNEKMREQINEICEAERIRREFSANVSHELKTPLTSIMGFSEIMKTGIAKPEDTPMFLEKINSEAKRLLALIDDIISLSGLDEDGGNIEMSDTDIYETAVEVAESLSFKAEKQKITLSVQGESRKICGNKRLLHEIIYNLCDNAIRYNNPGGYVKVSVGCGDGRAFVSVKDNGIGIPDPDKDRVFERFYRVDKSHSKETGGTGLGLSIVKHAAQVHNAEVFLESEIGKGTEIKVVF